MDKDAHLISEAYNDMTNDDPLESGDRAGERPAANNPVAQIVDMLTQGFNYLTKEEKLAGINMCRQLLDKLQEEVNKQP